MFSRVGLQTRSDGNGVVTRARALYCTSSSRQGGRPKVSDFLSKCVVEKRDLVSGNVVKASPSLLDLCSRYRGDLDGFDDHSSNANIVRRFCDRGYALVSSDRVPALMSSYGVDRRRFLAEFSTFVDRYIGIVHPQAPPIRQDIYRIFRDERANYDPACMVDLASTPEIRKVVDAWLAPQLVFCDTHGIAHNTLYVTVRVQKSRVGCGDGVSFLLPHIDDMPVTSVMGTVYAKNFSAYNALFSDSGDLVAVAGGGDVVMTDQRHISQGGFGIRHSGLYHPVGPDSFRILLNVSLGYELR